VFQQLNGVNYVNFVASSPNYREILSDNSYLEYLKFFVKNYSRFISSDFPIDELPEPEELMAKAKAEDDKLEEKGSFVVVKAGKEEGLFSKENEAPQNFVIAVKDSKFDLRSLFPRFNSYNKSQFANLNLIIQQRTFGDYQLMIVKSMTNIREAMGYFSKVVANRSLYESLETRSYRNFIITDSNLDKMVKESSIDDYIQFFRAYYISGNFAENKSQGTTTASAETVRPTPAEPEKPAYKGLFNPDVDGKQFFILIIPKQGVDAEVVKTAILSHNEKNYPTPGLTIDETEFDAKNLILKVSGINDKESGLKYLRGLVRDQQVYQPLMEVNYRNFVISPANFTILLKNKDVSGYLELYKAYYLSR
jgi:hypothetical protein